MEFFNSHIIPELQDGNHSVNPMLKSTSLKFVSTFRYQFSKQQLIALMQVIVLHLASPVVVVHTYAAFTIERILTTKDGNSLRFGSIELRPFLEIVFNSLFEIIGNVIHNENEHVMKCIMRILMVANEDVVPATQIVLSKLTDSLTRVAKNPRNPRYNHWLFESIAVLIKSVCKTEPKATTAFEALLFPPFQIILQMDVSEFTPYVFQIFAQLLEYSVQGAPLSDSYKGMLQGCLSPVAWERKGNIPALTRLLRAYVQKSAVEIVSMGSFMALLGVWQKLVSSKANEQCSFELLSSVTRYIPQDSLKPVLKQIFAILCTRLQSGKTARFVRLMTNFLALFVGIFGAGAFFEQLNTLQPNMSLMILIQVWLPRLKSDPPSRIDAKMHVIALTKLTCETQTLLSDQNSLQAVGEIVALTVFLLSSPNMGNSLVDEDVVETEISSDAGFSVLNNARKPIEDPFADISNPMIYFAQNLSLFSSSHPGQLKPFIQQSLSGDPKLAAGLENMLLSAGVTLA
jgi:exportin-2 (importin alpha re-exporter)